MRNQSWKENFTQFGSVFVLAGIVVLSLMFKYVLSLNPDRVQPVYMVYPAYETANPDNDEHIEKINQGMPFVIDTAFPEGWEIKKEGNIGNLPDTGLYCPYYLYKGDELVGYATFDVFEPLDKDVPMAEYYKHILKDDGVFKNYEDVKTINNAEFGICQVDDGNSRTIGVLAFARDVHSYVSFVFDPEAMDRDGAIQLCLKMIVSAE